MAFERHLKNSPGRRSEPLLALAACLMLCFCSSEDGDPEADARAGSAGSGAGGSPARGGSGGKARGGSTGVPEGGAGGAAPSESGGAQGEAGAGGAWMPPTAFTPAMKGGWQLGPELGATIPTSKADEPGCTVLRAIVRDFAAADQAMGHPDFETFVGIDTSEGLVQPTLGADSKPVYTGLCELAGDTIDCPYGQQTTSQAAFEQWYRYEATVNLPHLLELSFEPGPDGLLSFDSSEFFPLDGVGFGQQGEEHNFQFTTELHAEFVFRGGETLTFSGDDDVWVFVNGTLALDLGGVHPARTASVDFEQDAAALGLSLNDVYRLDLFHAERHTLESNFRLETNVEFTNCGLFVAD